ncbi:MAG: T9SS type A sorting domain-containing protein [Bacteroidales bacterium]|jgi:hypothetical protein|nr:T9SS type A sorting domain-containing protein [Bacteroidales bacterium]MDD4383717.1 T9SS type A sorting domain-containing protein [Bacteroidales bacterium]MDY0196248.1 T9SS type A sorting domain-containing protein [Tenuifilaceae bacterium]
MKQKIYPFILGLLFCAFAANAQVDAINKSSKVDLNTKFVKSDLKTGPRSGKVVYVNETFDTEIPATWTVTNTGTGDLPGWHWIESTTNFPFTGFARINSDANGDGNVTEGYLITPAFDCSAAGVVYLEFDVRYNDITTGGTDIFQVDVWNGAEWINVIDWDEDHGSATEAEHVSIEISDYASAACQVRFFYTDATLWEWYAGIDNVLVSMPEPNDLAVTSVLPNGTITTGSTITPTVTIENMGSNSQSTYNVTLVSTPAGYNETITNPGDIDAANTLVVVFPDWSPADGIYTLTATVILAGDANPGDNIGTSEINVKGVGFGDVVHSFNTFAAGCAGIETDGTNIYTVYWNPSVALRNFDKYTMDGTFVEEFEIAGVSALRDMAYNPNTGYFYGSAASTSLFEMDFANKTLVSTITAPTACRAIAYDDDDDTFWANNWDTDLTEFDITGAATGNAMPMVSIYGAAYDNWSDPANPTLWVFEGTGGGGTTTQLLEYAMDGTTTGRFIDLTTVPGFAAGAGSGSGGLASFEKDGVAYLLANIQQDPNLIVIIYLASTVATYDVTFNVGDGTNPIEGANIVVADLGIDDVTDASGQLVIADVEAGTYTYTVTKDGYVAFDGNFEVVDQDLDVSVSLTPTSINTIKDNLQIFPNPSNGQFTIKVGNNYYLEVMDITGKVVYTQELTNAKSNINLSNQAAGVYLIRLTNNQKTINHKIIIK